MGRRIARLLISLALMGAALAMQGTTVLAEPIGGRMEATPGGTLTLRLQLQNPGREPLTVTPRVHTPDDWDLVIPPDAVTVEVGEARVVLLLVRVARAATAGSYPIRVDVQSDERATLAEATFTVHVPAVDAVALDVLNAPTYVTGEGFTSTFLLRNESNRAHDWRLTARSSEGLPLEVDPDDVTLEAGASTEVRVRATTPDDLETSTPHVLTVRVQHAEREELHAVARSRSMLLPHTPTAGPTHHTFPLTVRFGAAGRYRGSPSLTTSSVDIGGSGPVSEYDPGHLSVRLKVDVDDGFHPEQALIAYAGFGGRVSTGRQSFPRTPLLSDETGWGVSVERRWGLTPGASLQGEVHAYLAETGPSATASVEADLKNGWEVGSTLHAGGDGPVVSLHGGYRDEVADGGLELSELTGAYALGARSSVQAPSHALGLTGRARDGPSTLAARYRMATDGFDGGARQAIDARAALRLNGYLALEPASPVNLHLAYGRDRQHADPADPASENRLERTFGATLTASNADTTISVGHHEQHVVEDAGAEATSRTHAQLRLPLGDDATLQQRLTSVRMNGDLPGNLEYEGAASIPTSDVGELSVHLDADLNLGAPRLEELAIGGQWSGRPSEDVFLRARAEVHPIGTGELADLELTGRRSFRDGHELDVELGTALHRGQRPSATLAVGYTLPVNVPLRRRTDIGTIEGHVRTPDGRGLEGIILTAGGVTAATREDGVFTLRAVPTGEQRIHLVPSTIPVGNAIITPATPVSIEVQGGKTSVRTFEVTPGATIRGRLVPRAPTDASGEVLGPTSEAHQWLHGATIELSNEDASLTARTNASGTFLLASVPPGAWTLRILHRTLPDDFQIAPAERSVHLEAGDAVTVEFELTPLQRRIRFQDGGQLSGDGE